MRRWVCLLLIAVCLSGCRAGNGDMDHALRLRQQVLASQSCSFDVQIVADYGDVIVHIFHHETRSAYQLDSLWNNGDNVTVYQTTEESHQAKVEKQDTHCWMIPKKAKEFVADDVIEWPEVRANVVLGDTIYIYVGAPKSEVCHKYKAQDGVLYLEKSVQAGCDKETLGFFPRSAKKLDQATSALLEKYFD